MSHKMPVSIWEFMEDDIFTINNKHYLCIVDYHSKFPCIKQEEGVSVDTQIKTCKIMFSEYRQAAQ